MNDAQMNDEVNRLRAQVEDQRRAVVSKNTEIGDLKRGLFSRAVDRLPLPEDPDAPKGYRATLAYFNDDGEVVLLGSPETEAHNCDAMGCSSVSHVIGRGKVNLGI